MVWSSRSHNAHACACKSAGWGISNKEISRAAELGCGIQWCRRRGGMCAPKSFDWLVEIWAKSMKFRQNLGKILNQGENGARRWLWKVLPKDLFWWSRHKQVCMFFVGENPWATGAQIHFGPVGEIRTKILRTPTNLPAACSYTYGGVTCTAPWEHRTPQGALACAARPPAFEAQRQSWGFCSRVTFLFLVCTYISRLHFFALAQRFSTRLLYFVRSVRRVRNGSRLHLFEELLERERRPHRAGTPGVLSRPGFKVFRWAEDVTLRYCPAFGFCVLRRC